MEHDALPSRCQMWEELAARYPQHTFIVAAQLPGALLLDVSGDGCVRRAAGVEYVLSDAFSADDFAAAVAAVRPDVAIAATGWAPPYDWQGVQDALVAERLRGRGIRTVCHSAEAAFTCFDKYRTRLLLQDMGFPVPRAVYVRHDLFWCERGHRDIRENVYKAYVLEQVRALRYPVVIKDAVGLSSYGLEVAVSYRQAVHCLCSGRTSSDRLVEEYLAGEQCGVEVYGADGAYTVLPPLLFSVNRYGITSPKQGAKAGPLLAPAYHADVLRDMLVRLARRLEFSGVAQADAVWSGGEWYILDINPRLSGMSETYAALAGESVPSLLLRAALGEPAEWLCCRYVCNMKLPLLERAQREELLRLPYVSLVRQTRNTLARQEREKGYCEIVLGGTETVDGLLACLDDVAYRFPEWMEPPFVQKARELVEKLRGQPEAGRLCAEFCGVRAE